jgi:hypothetical protein
MCIKQKCMPIDTIRRTCVPACGDGEVCNNNRKCQREHIPEESQFYTQAISKYITTRKTTTKRSTTTRRTTTRISTRTSTTSRTFQPLNFTTSTIESSTNQTSTFATETGNYGVHIGIIVAAAILSTLAVGVFLALLIIYLRRTGKLKRVREVFRYVVHTMRWNPANFTFDYAVYLLLNKQGFW